MTDTCEKCQKVIEVGEWPYCPHGFGQATVVDDQLHGGSRMFENLGHEPVYCDSRSSLKREMAARGLREFVRHTGMPGSDKSPQTQRFV